MTDWDAIQKTSEIASRVGWGDLTPQDAINILTDDEISTLSWVATPDAGPYVIRGARAISAGRRVARSGRT